MNSLYNKMEAAMMTPHTLEVLYRQNQAEFTELLPSLYEKYPDSPILQSWNERLFFQENSNEVTKKQIDIPILILLAFFAGTFLKIPEFIPALSVSYFYPRSIFFSFIPTIFIFFSVKERLSKRVFWGSIVIFLGSYFYLCLLPEKSSYQSNFLAFSHISLFLWSFVALYFVKDDIRKNWRGILSFFSFTMEIIVVTGLILLCGMLLTGMTLGLFSLLRLNITNWYMSNIVVYGAVASPIIAVGILLRNKISLKPIITTLARIFSPLALLTLVAYAVALIATSRTLLIEREALILFNAMLVCVLALSIFNIADRVKHKKFHWTDISTFGLIGFSLFINCFALFSILYRSITWGLSPNKLTILGMNILVLLHLVGISISYLLFLMGKRKFSVIEQFTAQYLPVYTIWSAFVVFIVPVMFGFQ